MAILDDYEVVVAGLAAMLAPYADRLTITELDAGVPATTDCDIVLFETFAAAKGERLDCGSVLAHGHAKRVVIYSWNLDPALVESSLNGGAVGYLSKSISGLELVDALERVHAGETVVSAGDVRVTADGCDPGDWPGRSYGLSEREAEIIALITQGLSNKEVATRAFLGINTVKSYIRSSYQKMGVTTRSRAVLWGVDHGFRPDHARFERAGHDE